MFWVECLYGCWTNCQYLNKIGLMTFVIQHRYGHSWSQCHILNVTCGQLKLISKQMVSDSMLITNMYCYQNLHWLVKDWKKHKIRPKKVHFGSFWKFWLHKRTQYNTIFLLFFHTVDSTGIFRNACFENFFFGNFSK